MTNFKELNHSSIVLTGYEFIETNPLGFFEFDDDNKKKNFFRHKKEGEIAKGKVIISSKGFKPIRDINGNNKADKEKFIVTRAKSRPVLIFQNVEFNKTLHDNYFVIPIQTLKKPDRKKCNTEFEYIEKMELYNNIKKRSENVYNLYYIPTNNSNGTIYERMLVLNDARFVHKSTLFGKAIENQISREDLDKIAIRLGKILNIQKLEQCLECKYNYENYISNSEGYKESAINDVKIINIKDLKKNK
ncbi:hypothetical protein [Clostridium perfringens]|uniref:hypothetical protein n=1 Tax=Clostridium perfringens TaxID=1502 RepID=UPI002A2D32EE|nr:hypothetical protein [Clostridium perfringens]